MGKKNGFVAQVVLSSLIIVSVIGAEQVHSGKYIVIPDRAFVFSRPLVSSLQGGRFLSHGQSFNGDSFGEWVYAGNGFLPLQAVSQISMLGDTSEIHLPVRVKGKTYDYLLIRTYEREEVAQKTNEVMGEKGPKVNPSKKTHAIQLMISDPFKNQTSILVDIPDFGSMEWSLGAIADFNKDSTDDYLLFNCENGSSSPFFCSMFSIISKSDGFSVSILLTTVESIASGALYPQISGSPQAIVYDQTKEELQISTCTTSNENCISCLQKKFHFDPERNFWLLSE